MDFDTIVSNLSNFTLLENDIIKQSFVETSNHDKIVMPIYEIYYQYIPKVRRKKAMKLKKKKKEGKKNIIKEEKEDCTAEEKEDWTAEEKEDWLSDFMKEKGLHWTGGKRRNVFE